MPNLKRGLFSSLAFLFAKLSRGPFFRVLVLLVVFAGVYNLYGYYERKVDEWHPEGMMKYHMEMTPEFYRDEFPESKLRNADTSQLGYNAVILYLVSKQRLRELILSFKYFVTNVNTHSWPILLFYTDDLEEHGLRREFELRVYDLLGPGEATRSLIRRTEWIKLEWELPEGFPRDKDIVKPVFEDSWPGYHLMCAFFAYKIFHHPRLTNVTYYLRLDTDSYIFRPLCYDPFQHFHARNLSYAYRVQTYDPDWVTRGLWELVDDYSRENPDVNARMERNGWWWPAANAERTVGDERDRESMVVSDFPTYYNNFEIVKLEAFRRPDVMAWLEEVMSVPERVYKYRWGDAPLRYATVNMFFDVKKEVEEYCAMRYWHNGERGNRCDCVP